MILGLLAAGEGSRLKADGIESSKGMVHIGGIPLLERSIRAFTEQGVSEVFAIVNEDAHDTEAFLRSGTIGVPVHITVRSTPSSLHSLRVLSQVIESRPFFLATIDSVYHPSDLRRFISYAGQSNDLDALLAVTSYVEDERPLRMNLSDNSDPSVSNIFASKVTAIGDEVMDATWIGAGLYWFSDVMHRVIASHELESMHRLRRFQQFLVDEGYRVEGLKFGKVIDVDHRHDLERAEELVKEWDA